MLSPCYVVCSGPLGTGDLTRASLHINENQMLHTLGSAFTNTINLAVLDITQNPRLRSLGNFAQTIQVTSQVWQIAVVAFVPCYLHFPRIRCSLMENSSSGCPCCNDLRLSTSTWRAHCSCLLQFRPCCFSGHHVFCFFSVFLVHCFVQFNRRLTAIRMPALTQGPTAWVQCDEDVITSNTAIELPALTTIPGQSWFSVKLLLLSGPSSSRWIPFLCGLRSSMQLCSCQYLLEATDSLRDANFIVGVALHLQLLLSSLPWFSACCTLHMLYLM